MSWHLSEILVNNGASPRYNAKARWQKIAPSLARLGIRPVQVSSSPRIPGSQFPLAGLDRPSRPPIPDLYRWRCKTVLVCTLPKNKASNSPEFERKHAASRHRIGPECKDASAHARNGKQDIKLATVSQRISQLFHNLPTARRGSKAALRARKERRLTWSTW
jgi:hypothetical protein